MILKMWNSWQKTHVCRIFQSQAPKAIYNIRGSTYILTGKQHSTITEINNDQLYTRSFHFSFKPSTYTEKPPCSKISEHVMFLSSLYTEKLQKIPMSITKAWSVTGLRNETLGFHFHHEHWDFYLIHVQNSSVQTEPR
jgi:hypothetical protein